MKKKLLAGFLAFALVASGIVVAPEKAEAADTGIKYVSSTEVKKDENGVPTAAGYVFGGWYDAVDGNVLETEGAYAKMVPDYVLSVKAQITTGTTAKDGKETSLRVISSVDSTDYKKVGFKILLANAGDPVTAEDGSATEGVKVYTGLKASGKTLAASAIFGADSAYLSTWRLDGIVDESDASIVYVQPYWETMDGTTVNGLARFLHVEDSYMNYISVPVNLTTGEAIAAGALSMAYDKDVVDVVKVEYGNVFAEMAHNDDEVGTIKFVGNGEKVNVDATANDLYANVVFKIAEEASYEGAASGTFLTFTVEGEDFADWDENSVAIDAADVQY